LRRRRSSVGDRRVTTRKPCVPRSGHVNHDCSAAAASGERSVAAWGRGGEGWGWVGLGL
jgi:hypothetical protein